MSARHVHSALRALSLSVLALCAVVARAAGAVAARAAGAVVARVADARPELAQGKSWGSTWLRLVIASLAACATLLSLARSTSASELPEGDPKLLADQAPAERTHDADRGEAITLSDCSVDVGNASFWAAPSSLQHASLERARSESDSAAPPSGDEGCTGLLDDPLAPAPLCDPSATTGVAAAYVRSVADDRLEAGPGCGDGEFDAQGWLGEREPDPTSWQQSSLEPADLSELATARAPSASVSLPDSACPGRRADGISMNIERPPMRS